MQYLSGKAKKIIPEMETSTYQRTPLPTDHFLMGRVEIDNDGCNGCELCVQACPANALEMIGKNAVGMVGDNAGCISCGDCIAICLPRVIRITRFQHYDGRYQFIGRGDAQAPRKF
ncbi:MAG: 4Fe-4S dicluster domain-containing protein [Pseudomonadota bacterium]